MAHTFTRILPLFCFLLATTAQAQLSHGGSPLGMQAEELGLPYPPVEVMHSFDVQAMLAEDERNSETKVGQGRFGKTFDTDISLVNSGIWTTLANGDRVWRCAIRSAGAISINIAFLEYELPPGAKIFAYDKARTGWVGSFTQENRFPTNGHGVLGVQPVRGEEIIIEYIEPAAVAGQGILKIGEVTHAYRDIFGFSRGLGDSGACNINVICPQGDPWREEIRSVALVMAGGGSCTGTLLNNCAQDTTPYFLTADHCLPANLDVSTWVFMFHWESDSCVQNLNGPQQYTISGSSLLVNSGGTDVALLLLSTMIPDSFGVHYAGWDTTGTVPDSAVGIHHPRGDIKKISFDNDPLSQVIWGGADCWEVTAWDDGTTEPGSSGSGLWSQDHYIIGQLFGGSASCTSNTNDDYGRFDVSWPLLKPFLGDCTDKLPGWPGGAPPVIQYDAGTTSITNLDPIVCNDSIIAPLVTIKNNGASTLNSITVNYQVDMGPVSSVIWTGSLMQFQTLNYNLPAIVVSTSGYHTLSVFTSAPNGNTDQNSLNDLWTESFVLFNPGFTIMYDLTLDNYGTETTWQLTLDDSIVLYEGGPYADGLDQTVVPHQLCLAEGCYTLTVYDGFGDGICCDEGDGHYEIYDLLGGQYVNGNGQFTDSISHSVCIVAVGVNEFDPFANMTLWPNPTSGEVNIDLGHSPTGPVLTTVYDLLGRPVFTERYAAGTRTIQMELGALSAGHYLVELRSGDTRGIRRVVLR